MHQSTVICTGLSNEEAGEALRTCSKSCATRFGRQAVTCSGAMVSFRLSAESDADRTGMALLVEVRGCNLRLHQLRREIHVSVESVLEV